MERLWMMNRPNGSVVVLATMSLPRWTVTSTLGIGRVLVLSVTVPITSPAAAGAPGGGPLRAIESTWE
jgi:hypothetical protein